MTKWKLDVEGTERWVVVPLRLRGRMGREFLAMVAIDTATPVTIIRTSIAQDIDLMADHPDAELSHLTGPTGADDGYSVPASLVHVFGHHFQDFRVHCHDIDESLEVDGVVGMDVIRQGRLIMDMPERIVEIYWRTSRSVA